MDEPTLIRLRPETAADLELLPGGDSPFDDFGPHPPRTTPLPSAFDKPGALVVIDCARNAVAGHVSWHWRQWGPNRESRGAMIGIWLRREFRGRGLGRAAQRELASLLFAETDTNRVEAHTDVENIAEQRALERAGFTNEGLVRGAQWRAGSYHDGYLYSILRSECSATDSDSGR